MFFLNNHIFPGTCRNVGVFRTCFHNCFHFSCNQPHFTEAPCSSGHDTNLHHLSEHLCFRSPRTHKDGNHTHATCIWCPIVHVSVCHVTHIHSTCGTFVSQSNVLLPRTILFVTFGHWPIMFLLSPFNTSIRLVTTTHFCCASYCHACGLDPQLVFSYLSFYRPRCVRVSASCFNARKCSWCAIFECGWQRDG